MATPFFLFPAQPNRATDANGDPVSGAKAYFFEAGTSTPLTVYSDTALTTPHSSPIVADSNGYFAAAYVSGPDEVKIRVDDASGNTLYTIDYVTGQPVGGLDADAIPFVSTARIASTNAQDAIEEVDGAVEELEAGFDLIVTTGSANAYLLDTARTSYTAYATGDVFLMEANHANTGAATVNVDSVGAKSIKFKTAGSKTDPASGEIQVGHILRIEYDGTDFVVTDHWRPMATQSQAQTGTAQGVLMDPLRVAEAIAAQVTTNVGYTEGTEQATTTGTAVDFTSLPSGVKRIAIMLDSVSTNGTDQLMIQLGDSGGVEASSYTGGVTNVTGSTGSANATGFELNTASVAVTAYDGKIILTREDSATFTWSIMSVLGSDDAGNNAVGHGIKALSAELDRVRLTTTGGTDTFDGGAVNISYEV